MTGETMHMLAFPPASYADEVARILAGVIRESVAVRGRCRVVLAGGRTPAAVYRALSMQPAMPWAQVEAYVGDERCVPPAHADSNWRMIDETLLSAVSIPAAHRHRMRGEASGDEAARDYDAHVALLPEPKFDLVISGVGADGHTASLFPGDADLAGELSWARPATAPEPFAVRDRVTLTLRALNSCVVMAVLCTGAEKVAVREAIVTQRTDAVTLPAALLRGRDQTLWLVDDLA